jgi:hypothetical protein
MWMRASQERALVSSEFQALLCIMYASKTKKKEDNNTSINESTQKHAHASTYHSRHAKACVGPNFMEVASRVGNRASSRITHYALRIRHQIVRIYKTYAHVHVHECLQLTIASR